ncbi:cupin domain-containing protein [Allostreptomyces psammosilenae]|uniref:Quercetin dioxygenase-like cupin family protein n=1 Tax=Allostreptomyces psammosilenae TaxID=1892865 RepID=A0A852ZPC2_9ACTN|nr:cupin domain-containing protein [Allostreptomyces psammosilenae]NYI04209.1 quercetin dioxygenase-like cupin family protein [Allostreptomyces psammosilenae]
MTAPDTPRDPRPGTPPAAPGRHRVPNLYRDLLLPKTHDHGGRGTLHAHRAYRRPAGAPGTEMAFVDLAVLPPGSSIGVHRHGDDEETYLVLRGSGLMHLDGEEFRVRAGDVVVNRPYGVHGLVNDSASDDLHLLVLDVAPARDGSPAEGR